MVGPFAHNQFAPLMSSESDSSTRHSDIEQVFIGPKFAAALHQIKRPQPAQGVVEAATFRFVAGARRDLLFVEPGGVSPSESLQNQPFCLAQSVPLPEG
jgi:hypothetical protein